MNVLHYDETTGFNHNTRAQSFSFFSTEGALFGYTVTQDSNGSEFTMASLANYDLVIFSNTSGDSGLTAAQQDAFEWYIDLHGGSMMEYMQHQIHTDIVKQTEIILEVGTGMLRH